ncbi:cytochrome C oxidase-related protein [Burkholderia humptydooensis MSMB43]|uniref:Cytochrome C oxidase-related protein n=1 Tax=Burkholderia humptydooensis MSMB43 TaxID=441157 RepID=A0ABN0G2Y3_9BURK|nr:cytochrome C oxidase-related protein [Burkholderia humptydooensis MSMB43]
MNNSSFWLLPVSSALLIGSFFVPGGAPAAGWTMYAPLSTQMGPGMDLCRSSRFTSPARRRSWIRSRRSAHSRSD